LENETRRRRELIHEGSGLISYQTSFSLHFPILSTKHLEDNYGSGLYCGIFFATASSQDVSGTSQDGGLAEQKTIPNVERVFDDK